MHILYLHQYFCPPGGSGGTRSFEIARRLVRNGHSVTMVTSSAFFPPNYKFSKNGKDSIEGIDLLIARVKYNNSMSFNRRIYAFLEFILKATFLTLKIKKTDLVYATSTPLTIIIPAFIVSRVRKKPLVFEIRDLWPELPIAIGAIKNPLLKILTRYLEKWSYLSSDKIIALSPGMKRTIVNQGIKKDKISVIPNGCDLDLFRTKKITKKQFIQKEILISSNPIVLYAGTFGTINNISYIIDLAYESLKLGYRINFILCGDGTEKNRILERAKKLNVLEKNLWIIDSVPKSYIPQIFNIATVSMSVFQNITEMENNSANKFFDTLASGKPIVINYRGWQAQIIEQSGVGIILPYENKIKAVNNLNNFLKDKRRINYASVQADVLSKGKFNRERQIKKLISILEDIHKKKI